MKILLRTFPFLFILGVSCTCSHSNKTTSSVTVAANEKIVSLPAPSGAQPLLPISSTDQLFLTASGEIFFVARNRPAHGHNQIYRWDEKNMTDRRLTYTFGECYSPAVSNDRSSMLYSCTTDEVIENPAPLREGSLATTLNWPFLADLPATEIYLQSLLSREIERMTFHPGFDGEPQFLTDNSDFIFSSWRDNKLQILRYKRKTKNLEPLFANPSHQFQANLSTSGEKLVWVRYQKDSPNTEIVVGDIKAKKTEALALKPGFYTTPRFTHDMQFILFSGKTTDTANFQIFAWDFKAACLKQVAEGGSNLRFPQMSQDLKTLYFSAQLLNQSQIFKMSKNLDSLTCIQ